MNSSDQVGLFVLLRLRAGRHRRWLREAQPKLRRTKWTGALLQAQLPRCQSGPLRSRPSASDDAAWDGPSVVLLSAAREVIDCDGYPKDDPDDGSRPMTRRSRTRRCGARWANGWERRRGERWERRRGERCDASTRGDAGDSALARTSRLVRRRPVRVARTPPATRSRRAACRRCPPPPAPDRPARPDRHASARCAASCGAPRTMRARCARSLGARRRWAVRAASARPPRCRPWAADGTRPPGTMHTERTSNTPRVNTVSAPYGLVPGCAEQSIAHLALHHQHGARRRAGAARPGGGRSRR